MSNEIWCRGYRGIDKKYIDVYNAKIYNMLHRHAVYGVTFIRSMWSNENITAEMRSDPP